MFVFTASISDRLQSRHGDLAQIRANNTTSWMDKGGRPGHLRFLGVLGTKTAMKSQQCGLLKSGHRNLGPPVLLVYGILSRNIGRRDCSGVPTLIPRRGLH